MAEKDEDGNIITSTATNIQSGVAAVAAQDAADDAAAAERRRRKKKKKVVKKPVEKAGLGERDDKSINISIEKVRKQLATAGKNKNLAQARTLSGRLQALIALRNSDA